MTREHGRTADSATEGWAVEDRVGDIVGQALALHSSVRDTFVRESCAADSALYAEVTQLLAVEIDDGDMFLVKSPEVRVQLTRPKAVGPFEILGVLGEGGMGTVYLAQQEQPVERKVALKVLRPFQHTDALQRMTAESQALARLSHPNICTLHEVQNYVDPIRGEMLCLVMEWVQGQQIGEWCNQQQLGLRQRLELFRGACEGIRHAHENGVLHCDIKPSNLLVTATGGTPTVKVIDFGIARALDDAENTTRSDEGPLVLCSPTYVSPEALAAGGRQRMGTRSDVYSLGMVLYELIVGVLPASRQGTLKALLVGSDPARYAAPSDRYCAAGDSEQKIIATQRGTTPAALRRNVRGDLDAIVLRAIAADPAQRYGSSADLWRDIEASLACRPVVARGGKSTYLVARFIRRHLAAVAVGSALLLAVTGGIVARALEAQRADTEARRALIALQQSEQVQDFLVSLFDAADPDRSEGAASLQTLLDKGSARLSTELTDQPLVRARLLYVLGRVYTKLGQLDAALKLAQESVDIYRSGDAQASNLAIESRSQLGTILRQLGRNEDAQSVLLEAIAQIDLNATAKPKMRAVLHNSLGNLYWRMQRYAEAEQQHRRALAIREKDPGAGRSVADSANNVGVMLLSQLRYTEAEAMLEQAAKLYAQTVGPDHPLLAGNLNNRGMMVRHSPRWSSALDLFVEATQIMQRHYGEGHPRTISSRRNVLWDRVSRRQWDLVDRELAELTVLVAALHIPRQSAYFAADKGNALLAAGRDADALAVLIPAQRRGQIDLAPTDIALRDLNLALAKVEARTGSLGRALDRLDRVQQSLPPLHMSRASVARIRGDLLTQAGRYREAEQALKLALEIIDADRRRTPKASASTQLLLATLHAHMGEFAHALEWAQQAGQTYSESYGPDHRLVADAQFALGAIHQQMGDRLLARAAFSEALRIRVAIYPPSDTKTEEARAKLADLGSH